MESKSVMLALLLLFILGTNAASPDVSTSPPRVLGPVTATANAVLAPVSGHVNATSLASGNKDLFKDALQRIADGFKDRIGVGVFSSLFEGPSPPTFSEIVGGTSGNIQNAFTKKAIEDAENLLDEMQYYFVHQWPEVNASKQAEKLEDNIQTMITSILSVLESDHCNQGASWSSYVLAGGLHVQLLQEEKMLQNNGQFYNSSGFLKESHGIASTAWDCWTHKRNKRIEALKDSISHKTYKFSDENKEIPDQSVQAKPDCMASGKHPRPWTECDRAVVVHDDMVDTLENKLEASCDYAEASNMIQLW